MIAPLRALGVAVGEQRRGQQEVLAARFLGDVLRDVVAVRRAVGRDRADHRHEPVLRPLDLRDLRDRRLQRAAAADRDHHRPRFVQVALHHLRAGDRELAVDRFGRVGIDRHDFAHREPVAFRQLRAEIETVGELVIDAHADQVLLDRERDEALRDRARHLQLFGDFILRVARDVVEPRGACGEIEFF